MNATPPNLFSLLLYICLFTAAILFSSYFVTKYTNLSSKPGTRLFAIGFLSTLLSMAISALWPGSPAFDYQWHDTYFVLASLHHYIAVALLLGLWTLAYYLTPSIIKRNLNARLSAYHGWISLITLMLVILLVMGHGYYFKEVYVKKSPIFEITIFSCLFLFLTSQLIFVINLIYSLWKPQQNKAL